jgi:hypothetical protein
MSRRENDMSSLLGPRERLVVFIVAAIGIAVAYAVFFAAPAVGTFHDDGVYLVTAQALAEGHGYRIISLPWEPAQTKYPILFPWLLSLVWRVTPSFPENLPWLRMVVLGASVIWFGLSWRVLRLLGTSREVAAAVLLLTAVSPWVAFISTTTLAETVFAALLTGAVLCLVRIDIGYSGRFDALGAGLLMGLACLTRAAGVGPVVGGFVSLALHRRWRALAEYKVGLLLLIGPWFWWVLTREPQSAIDDFYQGSIYGASNLLTWYSWSDKALVFGMNSFFLTQMGEYWGLGGRSWIALGVGLLVTVLIGRGLWAARTTSHGLVIAAYVAMLLLFVWPPFRYIVPLLPLLGGLAIAGAGTRVAITGVLAVLLMGTGAIELARTASTIHQKGGKWYAPNRVNDWHKMQAQYDWIARKASPDAVIVGIHDPTYFLFTGRKALRPFAFDFILVAYNVGQDTSNARGTVEDFRRRLLAMKADYIILTPRDGLEGMTKGLLAVSPGSLVPVMGDDPRDHMIYRVDRPVLSSVLE